MVHPICMMPLASVSATNKTNFHEWFHEYIFFTMITCGIISEKIRVH